MSISLHPHYILLGCNGSWCNYMKLQLEDHYYTQAGMLGKMLMLSFKYSIFRHPGNNVHFDRLFVVVVVDCRSSISPLSTCQWKFKLLAWVQIFNFSSLDMKSSPISFSPQSAGSLGDRLGTVELRNPDRRTRMPGFPKFKFNDSE